MHARKRLMEEARSGFAKEVEAEGPLRMGQRRMEMRLWRTRPILFAAVVGAVAGCVNVALIEFGGLANKNSGAVLPILLNPSRFGVSEAGMMQTGLILFIEFAGNVLGFALLFAVPVAIVVLVRRAWIGRNKPTADTNEN
jgi:hypothetical protein